MIEETKILAEFEGYKFYDKILSQDFNDFCIVQEIKFWSKVEPKLDLVYEGCDDKFLDYDWYKANQDNFKWTLNYHSDYNDLMRVWFKYDDPSLIRSLLKNDSHLMDIYFRGNSKIDWALLRDPIDNVFKLLVKEIKWLLDVTNRKE